MQLCRDQFFLSSTFDNTASGAALENAWELEMLASGRDAYP
jgi:hypothetical protein